MRKLRKAEGVNFYMVVPNWVPNSQGLKLRNFDLFCKPKVLYLYFDERRDIRWKIALAQRISWGLRLYFIVLKSQYIHSQLPLLGVFAEKSWHNTDQYVLGYGGAMDFIIKKEKSWSSTWYQLISWLESQDRHSQLPLLGEYCNSFFSVFHCIVRLFRMHHI